MENNAKITNIMEVPIHQAKRSEILESRVPVEHIGNPCPRSVKVIWGVIQCIRLNTYS